MDDIVKKKQAEIDLLLRDALGVQKEIEEIVKMAAEVSKKFAGIGETIQGLSKDIGDFAKEITKTFSKKHAKSVGKSVEKVANVVGFLTKIGGSLYADHKEEKMKEALLPKKQEIAKAKIDFINRMLPMIQDKHGKMLELCKSEAAIVLDFTDEQRYEALKKGVSFRHSSVTV